MGRKKKRGKPPPPTLLQPPTAAGQSNERADELQNEAPSTATAKEEAPHGDVAIAATLTLPSPLVESPLVESPLVESPLVESPLIESPLIESPLIESSPTLNDERDNDERDDRRETNEQTRAREISAEIRRRKALAEAAVQPKTVAAPHTRLTFFPFAYALAADYLVSHCLYCLGDDRELRCVKKWRRRRRAFTARLFEGRAAAAVHMRNSAMTRVSGSRSKTTSPSATAIGRVARALRR